jgi:hypothetical protein
MFTPPKLLTTCTLLVAINLMLICHDLPAQQQPRTWTSRDGQQVQATFSAYEPGQKLVSLILSDGSILNVRLSQFSHADRRHVLQVARKNQAGSDVASAIPDRNDPPQSASGRRSDSRRKSRQRFGINWTPGLENALAVAEGGDGDRDDRPVMWMRVLGDLEGFM